MNSELLLKKINEKTKLENEVERLDELKKAKEKRINEIMLKEIPEMMDDADVQEIVVGDYKVKAGVIYRSSITKANQEDAFKFLYDTQNEGIIKKNLIICAEQIEDAEAILQQNEIAFEKDLRVDNRVLGRVVRELVEDGKMNTDDMDKFSVYIQPDIKITAKKK